MPQYIEDVPRHVAIIMDGNGRWANQRNEPRIFGHRAGLKAVRKIIRRASDIGIQSLTLYAFSSENWRRPQEEVSALMSLFVFALKREIKLIHDSNIRLKIIGDTSRFTPQLQRLIQHAEQTTANNSGMVLNVAANYGGRWDIINATKQLCKAVHEQQLSIDQIDEQHLAHYLCLHEQPQIDLVIRTGGEYRISNFLLWQIAYAELYFTAILWPDFDEAEFTKALEEFRLRERRFGGTQSSLM